MSDKQWMEIFQIWRGNGLNDYQWCKENDVAVSTLFPSLGTRKTPEIHEVVQVDLNAENLAFAEHSDPLSMECSAFSLNINSICMDEFVYCPDSNCSDGWKCLQLCSQKQSVVQKAGLFNRILANLFLS